MSNSKLVSTVVPDGEKIEKIIQSSGFVHRVLRSTNKFLVLTLPLIGIGLAGAFIIVELLNFGFRPVAYLWTLITIPLISYIGYFFIEPWLSTYQYYISENRIIVLYEFPIVGTSEIDYMDMSTVTSYKVSQPKFADRYFEKFTIYFKNPRGMSPIKVKNVTADDVAFVLESVVESSEHFEKDYSMTASDNLHNNSSWVISEGDEVLFECTDSAKKRSHSILYKNSKSLLIGLGTIFSTPLLIFPNQIFVVLFLSFGWILLVYRKSILAYLFQNNQYIVTKSKIVTVGFRDGTASLSAIRLDRVNSVLIEQDGSEKRVGIGTVKFRGDRNLIYPAKISDITEQEISKITEITKPMISEDANVEGESDIETN